MFVGSKGFSFEVTAFALGRDLSSPSSSADEGCKLGLGRTYQALYPERKARKTKGNLVRVAHLLLKTQKLTARSASPGVSSCIFRLPRQAGGGGTAVSEGSFLRARWPPAWPSPSPVS